MSYENWTPTKFEQTPLKAPLCVRKNGAKTLTSLAGVFFVGSVVVTVLVIT